ncbi:unnamed protein product [Pleuronectes platessa]|uniref:Uncharacterized protein n=1 Tax=Pleuronectes platessa TaxID=8262 RepID=A0A9N7Z168_PLEPL|nr:unnamed protein product [Pleuronectes platessa]
MDLFEFDFFRDWELEQPWLLEEGGQKFPHSPETVLVSRARAVQQPLVEGPWSKVLNPPLLEWSCSGLNNKLRVSTHVYRKRERKGARDLAVNTSLLAEADTLQIDHNSNLVNLSLGETLIKVPKSKEHSPYPNCLSAPEQGTLLPQHLLPRR